MKFKIHKQLIKILPLFLLLFSISLFSQEAKKATGGTGQYKDRIWWLNFEGISLAAGSSQKRTFTVGSATVTVIIDQVAFSGRRVGGSPNLSALRLDGYNSSYDLGSGYYNHHGDGLDQMYNIGGANANNQLYYALTNNIDGDGNNSGVGITTTFRIRAYVDGLNTPLSLIFASAEADEKFKTGSGYEYTRSTTNGSAWQLLEKKVQSNDLVNALQRLKYSNNNLTAEMSMGTFFNPANVALLYTTKTSASLSAPLVVNTEMMSGGKSAIAIGLILDQDGGDAPSTFGSAVHSFQPLLTGGNPTVATQYLSIPPVLDSGILTVPNTLYLGNTPPDNDVIIFASANSDADDLNGVDDEDAFATNPVVLAACENSYSIAIPVHNTTGALAYLRGWIDFNGDGTFQSTESVSATVANGATSATLAWTGVTPITTTGYSVMRLRISNNNLTALEHSTTVLSGEVEDHRIQFLAVDVPTIDSIIHTTCYTPTGSFVITNYDSASTYTFSPSSGITLNAVTGQVIANSGTYTITATSGNCTASTSVTINNTSTVVAGTAAANQSIAYGTAPMALSLTGAVGSIQWQVSTDNTSFSDILSASGTSYAPGNLTQITYYRAKVTDAGCSVYSNVITIIVSASVTVSGQVVTPTLNSTIGTQGDGLWMNVVDKSNNKIVYVIAIDANGDFAIPVGTLIEGVNYDFILSKNAGFVGTTTIINPITVALNTGWTTVAEGINSTTPDGNANGIVSMTMGSSNVMGLRFALNYTSPNYCVTGDCNENTFLNTSDPNTIEYDNFISGFHSSIIKETDGSYVIWGQGTKPNTFGEHLYEPTKITPANGFNYTGDILKATLGTAGATNDGSDQYAILTTDGLFIWGGGDLKYRQDQMVHRSVKGSQTFDKMTTANIPNANTYGLPVGVNPTDVKMFFGSYGTIALTTCNGEAYVLSWRGSKNGDGTLDDATNYNVWHRVMINATTPLNGVVAMRGNPNALLALTHNGKLYTWGANTYLGDGSDKANRLFATQMTLPVGITPKMIGMTKASSAGIFTLNSYYLLSTTGYVYSLGDNSKKQLGTFDAEEKKVWVNVKSINATTNLTDIVWFSPNEHDAGGHAVVTALTTNGKLWGWGMNHGNMLGEGSSGAVDPRFMFGGLDANDKILAIETGGHINTLFKDCDYKLGYIGHNVNGSYATTSGGTNSTVFKFDGVKMSNLCAINLPAYPEVIDLEICEGFATDLGTALENSIPVGYTLQWWTTSNRMTGTEVEDPAIVTKGIYYAFFVSADHDCPNLAGEKVVVTENPLPVVPQDIANIKTFVNNDYEFTMTISGYETYTWEYATATAPTMWNTLDNTTYSDMVNLTETTFQISHATKVIDGLQIRLKAVSDKDCETYSNEVLINVADGAVITNPMLLNRAR